MTEIRVLAVTAVAAERDAVASGVAGAGGAEVVALPSGGALHRVRAGERPSVVLDVLAAGVGPAAAAAGTATALTAAVCGGTGYDLVISAGIGGGFAPGAPVGATVVADEIVAADLGAETPDGFVAVTELGFGTVVHTPPPDLVRALAAATGASCGAVLTASTVTGSAEHAARLAARHPRALIEAMEGFGVAEAAAAQGLPVLEIRTVSNPVGPRDRAAWRIGEALGALSAACAALPRVLTAAGAPTSWRTP
ncbi:menaquinone biosynthesis protein [Streptomyces rimosus]|uniref:Futalosine hydrolase n=1 Tax=Streptomyces rimosus subsp. rimosus TaxID=132474 RepID=A0ABY3Z0M5_STRRM|nr:menaquinone biosynthesis protein [Streptomyces rimosus]UNZ03673.1 Futalosine hydrolase [Streptomyces rimosus subsp. rimosus]UTH95181.1 Futalosine hydrolase [Streptomyces rimosus subsp. rimosus]UTJ13278.1 Futalosine hydrolase [Streptomyces rimosus subsp. rimosus]